MWCIFVTFFTASLLLVIHCSQRKTQVRSTILISIFGKNFSNHTYRIYEYQDNCRDYWCLSWVLCNAECHQILLPAISVVCIYIYILFKNVIKSHVPYKLEKIIVSQVNVFSKMVSREILICFIFTCLKCLWVFSMDSIILMFIWYHLHQWEWHLSCNVTPNYVNSENINT